MEIQTQNNQVAIIHNSIEIFRSAPEILKANQDKTQKALIVGEQILEQWNDAWTIENEDERLVALAAADERSNKYLVNCSNALSQEKEARAAITQMMDNFKKMFTEAENVIDKAKPNTTPAKVQSNRDTYAAEAYKINERRRIEAERIESKKKEEIELRSQAEVRLSNKYNDYLLERKTKLTTSFNAITLDTLDETTQKLTGYQPELKTDVIAAFSLGLYSSFHTQDEIKKIQDAVISAQTPDFASNYKAELSLLRDELVEKIPSKKAELVEQKRLADEAAAEAERQRIEKEKRDAEIAQANAEERKRLEAEAERIRIENEKRNEELRQQQQAAIAEQKRREEEEAARLLNEAEEAKRKAEQESEIKKQGDQTMAMFEKEASIAETTPTAEARQGYEIVVLHPVGYTQIFQLWFENEGKDLPVDKIGNTKMDQMKSWAEKYALKKDVKIESKFLKYEEVFKAVNRKAK